VVQEKRLNDLVGGNEADNEKNRLLAYDAMLDSSNKINEGIKIGLEIESSAVETLSVLNSNREIIERATRKAG
jgi:hypothetical protein